jgi:hypothetical protein
MKQRISETRPLPGMSREEWDRVRVSKSAAELQAMGCVHETEVDVPDPDPDQVKLEAIRSKSLRGSLTDAEIKEHNEAEIRLKAKGLLS